MKGLSSLVLLSTVNICTGFYAGLPRRAVKIGVEQQQKLYHPFGLSKSAGGLVGPSGSPPDVVGSGLPIFESPSADGRRGTAPLKASSRDEEIDEFNPKTTTTVVFGQSLFILLSIVLNFAFNLKLSSSMTSLTSPKLMSAITGGLLYTLPLGAFVLVTSLLENYVPALKKVSEATESTVLSLLGSKRRMLTSLFFACFLGAVAGLGEELLFRGCIQSSLLKVMPSAAALVATSCLFALGHAVTPLYAAISFVASLYFGWVFQATGDLMIPIVSHALYDSVAVLTTHYIVTGKTREERDALRNYLRR